MADWNLPLRISADEPSWIDRDLDRYDSDSKWKILLQVWNFDARGCECLADSDAQV
jgi:hypothetical protein